MIEDRGHAAQQSPLLHRAQVLQQALLRDPARGGGRRVWFGDHGHVALERADHLDVELVVGLAVKLDRLARLHGARERLRAALHLEVHADLEQPERGELAHRRGSGLAREHLSVPSRPSFESGSVAIVNQMLNSWFRR